MNLYVKFARSAWPVWPVERLKFNESTLNNTFRPNYWFKTKNSPNDHKYLLQINIINNSNCNETVYIYYHERNNPLLAYSMITLPVYSVIVTPVSDLIIAQVTICHGTAYTDTEYRDVFLLRISEIMHCIEILHQQVFHYSTPAIEQNVTHRRRRFRHSFPIFHLRQFRRSNMVVDSLVSKFLLIVALPFINIFYFIRH